MAEVRHRRSVLKNPILIRMSEWLERFLYRRADRVIVNSRDLLGTLPAGEQDEWN